MVEENLIKSGREMDKEKVIDIFEDEKALLDAIVFRMSKKEVVHINESFKKKSITTPKLLIKCHKHLTRKIYLPTILVISGKTFSANFENLVTWY